MDKAQDTTRDSDAHFVPVSDRGDMDRLLATSTEQPVVVFKHDVACSMSVNAYWKLTAVPGEVLLIDVARQKALSAEVATRLGIKHESPQVIVVRHGRPVYAASHWDITQQDVIRAAGGA
jgi:bacillithiol system protein YtxJ